MAMEPSCSSRAVGTLAPPGPAGAGGVGGAAGEAGLTFSLLCLLLEFELSVGSVLQHSNSWGLWKQPEEACL